MVEEKVRERRRLSFDALADVYHEVRPGYPSELFPLIETVCGIRPGARVLELGAGTGQATRVLLERGLRVTAVEPGANLARRLRDELDGPDLTILEADFEDAELSDAAFDLAVAATSLHWLDLEVVLLKLARVVRPDGWLAAWWTVFRDPDPERVTPFRRALEKLVRRHRLGRGGSGLPNPLDQDAWTERLAASGVFDTIEVAVLRQSVPYTAARLSALFSTFTEISDLPEQRRAVLLDDISSLVDDSFGGEVIEHHVTMLYLARLKGEFST